MAKTSSQSEAEARLAEPVAGVDAREGKTMVAENRRPAAIPINVRESARLKATRGIRSDSAWMQQIRGRAVTAAIRAVAEDPRCGEALVGALDRLWKYRIRRSRTVYAVDRRRRIVPLMAFEHRADVHHELGMRLRARR